MNTTTDTITAATNEAVANMREYMRLAANEIAFMKGKALERSAQCAVHRMNGDREKARASLKETAQYRKATCELYREMNATVLGALGLVESTCNAYETASNHVASTGLDG